MAFQSNVKAIGHHVLVSLVPYLIAGEGSDHMSLNELHACEALTDGAEKQHGAGHWEIENIEQLDEPTTHECDATGETGRTCAIHWIVKRIEAMTLFGSRFRHVYTGVCDALEATNRHGWRILICNNECDGLPTGKDWLIGVYDEYDMLIANHYSDGRFEQIGVFGKIDEIADLLAGVPSMSVRIACVFGPG